jgi:hypothetical protein
MLKTTFTAKNTRNVNRVEQRTINANIAARRKRKREEPIDPVPRAAPAAPQHSSGSGLDGSRQNTSGPATLEDDSDDEKSEM